MAALGFSQTKKQKTLSSFSKAAREREVAGLLGPFPSGDALDALTPDSSRVVMRTTYLSAPLQNQCTELVHRI